MDSFRWQILRLAFFSHSQTVDNLIKRYHETGEHNRATNQTLPKIILKQKKKARGEVQNKTHRTNHDRVKISVMLMYLTLRCNWFSSFFCLRL